jgi:hypothetical protein
MNLITIQSCISSRACYSEDELKQLDPTGNGLTPLQVAALPIPAEDRHWALIRAAGASDRILREHACWCARRALALAKNPDPRSVHAVEVAERFARGEATREELLAAADAARAAAWGADAARDAAWDAAADAAWDAAADAAWDAARAAWAAAEAAWDADAACAAERELQIKDLAERLMA